MQEGCPLITTSLLGVSKQENGSQAAAVPSVPAGHSLLTAFLDIPNPGWSGPSTEGCPNTFLMCWEEKTTHKTQSCPFCHLSLKACGQSQLSKASRSWMLMCWTTTFAGTTFKTTTRVCSPVGGQVCIVRASY